MRLNLGNILLRMHFVGNQIFRGKEDSFYYIANLKWHVILVTNILN